MIPLNRKERYLNQIVGWGNTAPEKPLTPEEFFFSAILGEDVQLPDLKNATRYELFLAKIAGININISPPTYTSPRIEFFLARAAGMNVPELVPLTREEIFWSNYVAVVEKILEGLPPLTYKAKKAGTLTDYRIYGQTSRNLFDGVVECGTWDITTHPCSKAVAYQVRMRNANFIKVAENSTYSVTMSAEENVSLLIHFLDEQCNYISETTWLNNISNFNTPSHCEYINIIFKKGNNEAIALSDISSIMLNTGSTPLPYEPYGESVGDRTGNLFDGELTDGYHLDATTGLPVAHDQRFATLQPITIKQGEYCLTYNRTTDLRFMYSVFNDDTLIRRVAIINDRYLQSGDAIDTTGGNKIYFAFYNNDYSDATTGMISNIMLNSGSTPISYEPYGYRVPVTVSNGTDTLTTSIYLPEQIRKVGDEAEYIDYGDQKQHRVRKNLLQNTATSQTINGVTFTVNADGSVTCNTDENGATGAAVFIVKKPIYLDSTTKCILAGCPNGGGANTYRIQYADSVSRAISDYGSSTTFFPFDASAYPEQNIAIVISENTVCNNLTFYPMIRKADIEDDTYEPYIENTDLDVTLPALPTLTGTNVLSVGTEVQPSNVYIEYEGVRGE